MSKLTFQVLYTVNILLLKMVFNNSSTKSRYSLLKACFLCVQTMCGISQLSADHPCIIGRPQVITHCAPRAVLTDLHSAFKLTLTPHKS